MKIKRLLLCLMVFLGVSLGAKPTHISNIP